MDSRKDIQRELKQINSSLPFDAKMPVFDLPEGYFENFASGVLATVKGKPAVTAAEELATLSPLLAGLSKKMPYDLPDNYFSEQIAAGLPAASEDPEAAWMQIGKKMPYTLPDGYFEHLASQVAQQVKPRPQAKVIPILGRKWVQYAAAAVLTGALVLGSLLYPGDKPISPASQPAAWIKNKLRNVSNQELEAFIETVPFAGNQTARQNGKRQGEVRKMLKDVPDSELEAFLSQMPSSSEHLN